MVEYLYHSARVILPLAWKEYGKDLKYLRTKILTYPFSFAWLMQESTIFFTASVSCFSENPERYLLTIGVKTVSTTGSARKPSSFHGLYLDTSMPMIVIILPMPLDGLIITWGRKEDATLNIHCERAVVNSWCVIINELRKEDYSSFRLRLRLTGSTGERVVGRGWG